MFRITFANIGLQRRYPQWIKGGQDGLMILPQSPDDVAVQAAANKALCYSQQKKLWFNLDGKLYQETWTYKNEETGTHNVYTKCTHCHARLIFQKQQISEEFTENSMFDDYGNKLVDRFIVSELKPNFAHSPQCPMNHDYIVLIRSFQNIVRKCQRSLNLQLTFNQIYNDELRYLALNFPPRVVQMFPPQADLHNSMYYAKNLDAPTEKKLLSDFKVDGSYAKTEFGDFLEPEDFLMFDKTFIIDGKEQRMIAFGTKYMVQLLCKQRIIHLDGTFKTCPRKFYQYFTMHTKIKNRLIPCVHALFTCKQSAFYSRFFAEFKIHCAKIGIDKLKFASKSKGGFVCDFESGLLPALQNSFPGCNVCGCYFHFCQAIWRNCQSQGFLRHFNDKIRGEKIKDYIKQFMALAFVPVEHVRKVYDELVKVDNRPSTTPSNQRHLNLCISKFTEYFESYWMSNKTFDISYWNVSKRLFMRSNNHLEGYHSQILKRLGLKPRIYRFIAGIQKEQTIAYATYLQVQACSTDTFIKREKTYVDIDKRIEDTHNTFTERLSKINSDDIEENEDKVKLVVKECMSLVKNIAHILLDFNSLKAKKRGAKKILAAGDANASDVLSVLNTAAQLAEDTVI